VPTVTVAGANSQTVTLTFDTNANAVIAQQLAAAITSGVQGGTITPADSANGPPPAVPPGTTGYFIQSTPGVTVLPPGYTDIADTAPDAVIFGSGDPNESVLISAPHATFFATGASGSGTVVAGSGANSIFIQGSVGGAWSINTENGNDQIKALGGGDDTISAGGGNNAIQLGSGHDFVNTTGDDTVLAGSGSDTVVATGTGTDVINASSGNLFFVAAAGATILGGTGSDTFFGGNGPDCIQGGTAGNNFLQAGSGPATLFGGGNGDSLFAGSGSVAQALHAGSGNETLFGGFSTGQDTFFAGSGNASIGAGGGSNQFVFTDGQAGGADTIQGFASGRDLVDLQDYGKNEIAKALKSQTFADGTATITLSDHTTISFVNLTGKLTASDFVTTSGAAAGASAASIITPDGDNEGHGSQSLSDSDDHGQIRNSIIGHS
jgi:Ca2+-binding RTX toxin-like protein